MTTHLVLRQADIITIQSLPSLIDRSGLNLQNIGQFSRWTSA